MEYENLVLSSEELFSVETCGSTLASSVNGSLQVPRRGGKAILSLMKKERLIYYKLLGTKIIWTNHLDGQLAPVVSLLLGCFPTDGIGMSGSMVNTVDLSTLAVSLWVPGGGVDRQVRC